MAPDSFDPPSDFDQAGGGGGGGTSIWLWLGVGCGVILLLASVGLGFGFYRGYTCCREQLEMQQAAAETATDFAVHLRNAAYDEAMSLTTESFRKTTGREDLLERVDEYRSGIENSVPELVGLRPVSTGSNSTTKKWNASIAFRPHAGETYVKMGLELERKGSGEEAEFEIDQVEFQREERNIATEPPARTVRRFNTFLEEESLGQARNMLAKSFEAAESEDAFKSYVQEHGEALKSDDLAFDAVEYGPDRRAVVRAVHTMVSGTEHRAVYILKPDGAGWAIHGIEFRSDTESEEATPASGDAGGQRTPERLEDTGDGGG